MKNPFRRLAVAALMLTAAGCFPTEPKPLVDEFTWESVPNQSDITEGVSIAGFFSDISFLGQAKTPTLCYSVSPRLVVEGTKVTVTIHIVSSGSGTCAQQAGGVRYTGVVRNLPKGTYEVHIIQDVRGVGTTEFTETVKL